MQRCPKCNRTYEDDSQKFCTFDGGRLMVDTDAPTTLDLAATVHTADPLADLGATVMGSANDLNRTVAGNMPPLTSEIPPPAQTGPTNPSQPAWSDDASTAQQPTAPVAEPSSSATTPLIPSAAPSTAPTAAQTGSYTGGSLPGVPSGSLAAPPAAAQQAGRAAAPPAARKSNRIALLFGGMAALLLLVIVGGAAAYFLMSKRSNTPATNTSNAPSLSTEPNTSGTTKSNSNNSNSKSATSQPPVEAPPNSTKFTNSRDKLSGSLAEHHVDFSLYYPNDWALDPKAGTSGSSNFFSAERTIKEEAGDYMGERFVVGWYQSNGTVQLDRAIFPNRVEYFNNQYSKSYPNYQKVSEGETTINGVPGYEFTFKSSQGNISIWGRMIFLPVGDESARNGIALVMLASSAAPEIKSLNDLGEKGELPVILKTFRLGPS